MNKEPVMYGVMSDAGVDFAALVDMREPMKSFGLVIGAIMRAEDS